MYICVYIYIYIYIYTYVDIYGRARARYKGPEKRGGVGRWFWTFGTVGISDFEFLVVELLVCLFVCKQLLNSQCFDAARKAAQQEAGSEQDAMTRDEAAS